MTFTAWQKKVIADAADQPDASYAALSRWAGIHVDSLRKARLRDPAFDQAIQDARARRISANAIVDIEQFVRDKEFLGLGVRDAGGTLYPAVLEELKRINGGEHSLVILAGGIGSAKTFTAVISLLFQLYRLMMEPDPHASCGLDKNSPIIFAVQNKNVRLAERNDYSLARRLIEGSPWFATHAPHDARIKSRVQFLKHSIELWPVGGDSEALLGLNLHSALIDEVNFHSVVDRSKKSVDGGSYDGARESFESIIRRKLSRFDANTGMIFVASSRRYRGEFTSELEAEYHDDPRLYVYDHTAWSINPDAYRDEKWFPVFRGDSNRPARVLEPDEEVHPRDRHLIVSVPEKFRRQFQSNVTRSLQDLAGIAVERIGGFFTDKAKLQAASCLDNVLCSQSDVVADAMLLFPQTRYIPFENRKSPRAIHCDLSLTGDKTGICVGHIRGFDDEGRPHIDVDGLARVAPPLHGEIVLDQIFKLVAAWQSAGVLISRFSCDGYMSRDLLQRVGALGIRVGVISVDQTSPGNPCEAYESLRLGIVESRIRFPRDQIVVDELLALELDRKRNRIDHPPNGGTKDSADALAGCVYSLSQIPAWQLVDKVPNADYAAALRPALGGQITGVPNRGIGGEAMALIRVARGMPERY